MKHVFVSVEDSEVQRVELDDDATVAKLLEKLGGGRDDMGELFAFKEDDDDPLDAKHKLRGDDEAVFHVNRCRSISVTVHYGSKSFVDTFAPGTTIGRLARWATKEAELDKAEAEEQVLQIGGTRTQPPKNAHLGTVASGTCAITFDLVRKQLVQG